MSGTRLRVAYITGTFPPYRSGTGVAVWHQAAEMARRGHSVHVFTPVAQAVGAAPKGVDVHVLRPWLRVGNASVTPWLVATLRGFDVVHLHYPFFSAAAAWAAARLSRSAFVVTYLHDVLLQGPLGLVPRVYDSLIGQHVLAHADRLLFLSLDYARASYVARLANRPNVRELPLGVDERVFAPRPFCGEPHPMNLLMVAALDRAHYFKGVSVLFEALEVLRRADVRLTIIGDGDLRGAYEREARERGLSNRVYFAGSISDADLPGYYATADALVMPSLTRGEAFGLVLLEAMATSRPVIASRLPGVSALVERTGGGLLFTPGNAPELAQCIERLVDEPALRGELGGRGRHSVETTFNWRVVGAELERTYREVVGARH